MISYCNNEYLKDNTRMDSECQMLFYQKMKELLHMHSGISYSFKIHNSYTILKELLDTVMDYERGKINGLIVEEIRKEAKILLADDLVIKSEYPELFEAIKEEIGTGLAIDKNNQSIEVKSIPKMNMMKEAVKQLFRTFTPVDYFKNSIALTKVAIDDDDGEKVVRLCSVIVSSSIMVGRSISGMYRSIGVLFENQECQFADNWKRWSASMLNTESTYQCFIPIDEGYSNLVDIHYKGAEIKQQYAGAKNLDYIEDGVVYFFTEITAPASDLPAIYNKVFSVYRNQMSIIEFATAKVGQLEKSIVVRDDYNNSFVKIEQRETNREYVYKPFNQYHVNIDQAVKNFVDGLSPDDCAKVMGTIMNVCNFEGDSNEYGFLLLWSSLEALFRSSQFEKAMGAIKNTIPDIMTRRYVYYRLIDFIKDAEKAKVEFSYKGREFIKKSPSDDDIEAFFGLLQDRDMFQQLADLCKQKYVLLYYKCAEVRNMVINAGAMRNIIIHHRETLEFHLQRMYRVRNKFVHHAEINENIEALYKHLLVYSWECIREMAYVSKTRGIKSLEELYSYFRMNYKISLKCLQDVSSPILFKNIKNGYLM